MPPKCDAIHAQHAVTTRAPNAAHPNTAGSTATVGNQESAYQNESALIQYTHAECSGEHSQDTPRCGQVLPVWAQHTLVALLHDWQVQLGEHLAQHTTRT